MDIKNVVVATITWARDAQEEQVLRASLNALAQLAIPVFITDGGSSPSFIQFLQSFPHFQVLLPEGRGVWAQAKKSIQAAAEANAPSILYTEPDKKDFFQRLPDFIAKAPDTSTAGIILASRSVAGYATFPAFQQMTETTINQCCAEIIGEVVDYTYGPFLFNRNLVPSLSMVPEDMGWGWGWRPYLFGVAHRLQYEVISLTEDFGCPLDQRADTPAERIYRMRQLNQNIQGLVFSTTVPLP